MVFNRRIWNVVVLACLCFFACHVDCFADTIYLKSGQEEQGRIIDKNADYVVLYAKGIPKTYPSLDILRIVEGVYVDSNPASLSQPQELAGAKTNGAGTTTLAACDLGFESLKTGELDRAIKFFDEAIQDDPNSALAYQGRVKAYLSKAEKAEDPRAMFLEVLKDASEVVRLDPSQASGWLFRAKALRKLGRPDESIVDYEKALSIDSYLPGAYRGRAQVHYDQGNFDSAINDYSKAIALTSDDKLLAWAFSERAGVYVRRGDFVRAEVDCDRAIQLDPACYFTYEVRARILAARKDYDRAWADVRKAQELGAAVKPEFLAELSKNAPSV